MISNFFKTYPIILAISSCNLYYDKAITLTIVNELQGCEENNLHYKIVGVTDKTFANLIGSIVLPVMCDSLDNDKYNELFFPSETVRRTRIVAEGFYSKRGHNRTSIGCVGSHLFLINRVLHVQELTDEYDYEIRN